ncbi:MAG TPA: rhodanese-like domain-containing protein [Puia sp.]|nr:rhodanese-like domain-containing protein [Puia sp.]
MQLITVDELKERLDRGEKLHLLDVRQPSENTEYNIGGTLLPLGQIQAMDVDVIDDWRDEEIICYCRSGNRSGQACIILDMLGFKNTKNLTGGILAWKEKFG